MGLTWTTRGSLTFHPPMPLGSICEVLIGRWPSFEIAPAGLVPQALAALTKDRQRTLVPADTATYNFKGLPSLIESAHIHWDAHYMTIGNTLRQLTVPAVTLGHDFDGALTWVAEDGAEGEINFFEDGELIWDETRLPPGSRVRPYDEFGETGLSS
ncbi:hypothetical protein [Streptomyces syringium]|uniref:hypothetical protein n=1 Tax=Streptomyces syringium TaxID=76729 RepID=UPI0033C004B2